MQLLTFDAETYYAKDYSLSKLTTEEYVRDPRFEVIGFAMQFEDNPPMWFSGDMDYLAARLENVDWDDTMLLCQNTAFDAAILSWHFDIHPKVLLDTMSMARPIVGQNQSVSLANLSRYFGLGEKGDEVIHALGKRRSDFTREELARYGEYCRNDVALTYKLYTTMLAQGFPIEELKLIDLTLKMFTEPVLRLNPRKLEEHLNALRTEKRSLLVNCMKSAQRNDLAALVAMDDEDGKTQAQKLLRSDAQFAKLLEELGVEPATKVSPKTGKTAFAFAKTDAAFKELVEHEDPAVQALAAARLGTKTTIEESRTERFMGIAHRGSFPVPLKYYAAHSGRWGGSDAVNLQNLASRGKHAKKLKRAIEPPPGYVILDCDSSQIEARVVAWLAGQDDLVEAFRNKEDVYSQMATRIYRRPVDRKRVEVDESGKEFKPDETPGQVGKTVVLACGYGMGGVRFRDQLRAQTGIVLPAEETARIVKVYRETAPAIPKLWKDFQNALDASLNGAVTYLGPNNLIRVDSKGIRLPNGLYIQYPELQYTVNEDGKREMVYKARNGYTRIYGAKAVENVCQALARLIVGYQMIKVSRRYRVVLTVHDSVLAIAKVEEAEAAKQYIEKCMRATPEWASDLPIDCECGYGPSYGDVA